MSRYDSDNMFTTVAVWSRTRPPRAHAARGSGLVGLADRVEALAGTIAVHSPAGKGTAIVVSFPIAAERDQEIAAPNG